MSHIPGSPEAYSQPIEHPQHDGWLPAMTGPFPQEGQDALRKRFAAASHGLDFEMLLALIETESMSRELTRHVRDMEGVARLLIDADEREIYRDMAGESERAGELITWFGTVAANAFGYHPVRPKLDNIGLDLGGKRFLGKVGGTRSVDEMVKKIPDQVSELDPTVQIIKPDTIRDRTTRYQIRPLRWDGKALKFARITRRKGVMDLTVSTGNPQTPRINLEVFESNTGLIVMPQVPAAFREQLDKWHRNERQREASMKTDSRAALLAGRLLERTLADTLNSTTVIAPIGMHYVLLARRTPRTN